MKTLKLSRFMKDKFMNQMNQPPVSSTMNKIKSVSNGGLNIATPFDLKLALIEINIRHNELVDSYNSINQGHNKLSFDMLRNLIVD